MGLVREEENKNGKVLLYSRFFPRVYLSESECVSKVLKPFLVVEVQDSGFRSKFFDRFSVAEKYFVAKCKDFGIRTRLLNVGKDWRSVVLPKKNVGDVL